MDPFQKFMTRVGALAEAGLIECERIGVDSAASPASLNIPSVHD